MAHPNPTEIASAITQLFDSLPTRLGEGKKDSGWTKQLKEDIGSLGVTHGWAVCTSGFPDRFDPEWLYDLIWYRSEPDNHLAEVYLVMESEWAVAPASIKYDFEKLLLAKSSLKVMVFEAYDRDIAGVFSLLESGIRAFQKKDAGEIYILAGYNMTSGNFVVRRITVA